MLTLPQIGLKFKSCSAIPTSVCWEAEVVIVEFQIVPCPPETMRALAETNRRTARYGLALTPEQITALAESRTRALLDTGRVELGAGILPRLIGAFCDSPYLHQTDYAITLEALQAVFYRCKNEAGDLTPDEDILRLLRRAFDRAGGSVDYLEGFSPRGAGPVDAGGLLWN